ncbi:hydroxyacylglutathione hydrolase [Kistimonas asteriae]|uniref:hydroxyacylglutathione hydrolase n=1 Tax=Kistimonas asteriae TaxID=517724 RepID=UPI001BA8F3E5|nr:hydroxyacylglutathione hydrolase [Kistimonas asteriae]
MINVTGLPAFNDNYIWLLTDPDSRLCHVVDPGDGDIVLKACRDNNLELAGILITHHHGDHTGGIRTLLAHHNVPVYGPANEQIPDLTHPLSENDTLLLHGCTFRVIETPGHTAGHIAYYGEPEQQPPILFCGDTLFAGGCGRLFEGTPAQMLASLTKLSALPDSTQIYCAHEYTLANLRFAQTVETDNAELQQRLTEAEVLRQSGKSTVPSDMATERATNPFLRSSQATIKAAAEQFSGRTMTDDTDTFAAIRRWKDSF